MATRTSEAIKVNFPSSWGTFHLFHSSCASPCTLWTTVLFQPSRSKRKSKFLILLIPALKLWKTSWYWPKLDKMCPTFQLNFYYSFFSACLGLNCFSFPSFSKWKLRLLISDSSSFLIYEFSLEPLLLLHSQILIILIISKFKIFFNFSWDFLWSICYLQACLFIISKYLGIFQLFCYNWFLA